LAYGGYACFYLRRDEEALFWLRQSIEINLNFPGAHFCIAAAYAHLGRTEEARTAVKSGLAYNPGQTIANLRALRINAAFLSQRERFLDGLRIAGLPEE
jgi:tetratricopeptide (TPR) repeat protein